MPKKIIPERHRQYIGKQVGSRTVCDAIKPGRQWYFMLKCVCGVKIKLQPSRLRKFKTVCRKCSPTRDLSPLSEKLYRSFQNIKRRALNAFPIQKEWLKKDGFLKFKEALGVPPSIESKIARKNLKKGFMASNLVWVRFKTYSH